MCACVERKTKQKKTNGNIWKNINRKNIENNGRNLTGNYYGCVYLFGGFEVEKEKERERDHKSAHLFRFLISFVHFIMWCNRNKNGLVQK